MVNSPDLSVAIILKTSSISLILRFNLRLANTPLNSALEILPSPFMSNYSKAFFILKLDTKNEVATMSRTLFSLIFLRSTVSNLSINLVKSILPVCFGSAMRLITRWSCTVKGRLSFITFSLNCFFPITFFSAFESYKWSKQSWKVMWRSLKIPVTLFTSSCYLL